MRVFRAAVLLWLGVAAAGAADEQLAKHLVGKAGVRRGVCAVLDDSTIAEQIARASELLVHGVETSGERVETCRKALGAAGLYGTRVVVEKGILRRLPYADNLFDVVVCTSLTDGPQCSRSYICSTYTSSPGPACNSSLISPSP